MKKMYKSSLEESKLEELLRPTALPGNAGENEMDARGMDSRSLYKPTEVEKIIAIRSSNASLSDRHQSQGKSCNPLRPLSSRLLDSDDPTSKTRKRCAVLATTVTTEHFARMA
jgi:hypothetical protein